MCVLLVAECCGNGIGEEVVRYVCVSKCYGDCIGGGGDTLCCLLLNAVVIV